MTQLQTRFTTEALVIKEMNVGESDRLVTLFTRDLGIIKAFASGAKNIKSKKGAATALLTYSSFTILDKKGTYRIYEATPIAQFFSLGSDIETLTLSQYFCELALHMAPTEAPATEHLRLLLNALHYLSEGSRDPMLIKAVVEGRLLCLEGYTPDLTGCHRCGRGERTLRGRHVPSRADFLPSGRGSLRSVGRRADVCIPREGEALVHRSAECDGKRREYPLRLR